MVPYNFGEIFAQAFHSSRESALQRQHIEKLQEERLTWEEMAERRRIKAAEVQAENLNRFANIRQRTEARLREREQRNAENFSDYTREEMEEEARRAADLAFKRAEYVRTHQPMLTINERGDITPRMIDYTGAVTPGRTVTTPLAPGQYRSTGNTGLARASGQTQYVPARPSGLPAGEVPWNEFGLLTRAIYTPEVSQPPRPPDVPWYRMQSLGDNLLDYAQTVGGADISGTMAGLGAATLGTVLNIPKYIARLFGDTRTWTPEASKNTYDARWNEYMYQTSGEGQREAMFRRLRAATGISSTDITGEAYNFLQRRY